MNLNTIGSNNQELKLDGYFYQLKKYETYPYYRNEYGGYQQDTTKKYSQIRILPLTLYSDGSVNSLYSFSGFQDNHAFNYRIKCSLEDNNTIENAFEHFECYLRNRPENKLFFINKKAEIWNQGIYKIEDNKITIQIFYNSIGDYYLYEENGIILNDTTFVLKKAKDYQTGKEYKIEKEYHFKKMNNMPKMESYILKNKKKFNKN